MLRWGNSAKTSPELTEFQGIWSQIASGRHRADGSEHRSRPPLSGATRTTIMRIKALAAIIVLILSAALFVQMRKDNRADAAASNCYSDAKGPSAPTICN